MKKPFILAYDEAKKNIVAAVNEAAKSGVPFVLIGDILSSTLLGVRECAQQEREAATKVLEGAQEENATEGADAPQEGV